MNKKTRVVFCKTHAGDEPVRKWLISPDLEDKKSIGSDIKLLSMVSQLECQYHWHSNNSLYEVRSNISHKRIARVIFTIIDNYMVLLNGFIKRTQKTPQNELDLALKRARDIT